MAITSSAVIPSNSLEEFRIEFNNLVTDVDALEDISIVSATTTVQGKAELATTAETVTGTDTARVVTPAGLHGALAGLTDTTIVAGDSIIFAGRRSGDELKALYKHARVFVLPSYHEGLPIVALEAISAGTPVILSDILPNKDIEAPVDSYFEVGDIAALANKLTNLDSLDLALDQNRYLYIFNWDRIADNTLSLMKSVFIKGNSR